MNLRIKRTGTATKIAEGNQYVSVIQFVIFMALNSTDKIRTTKLALHYQIYDEMKHQQKSHWKLDLFLLMTVYWKCIFVDFLSEYRVEVHILD